MTLVRMLKWRRSGPTMHITALTDPRTSEIGKILETESDIELLQQHLKEVIEGAAFKASHRSGQFLKYIVDQAIAGHFESLKERVIGIELFGRSPSYDTGEDAIVRVTASDVRKRLLQHYGKDGATSEFRISLPLGAYVPEIARRTRSSRTAIRTSVDLRGNWIKGRIGHIRTCCKVWCTLLIDVAVESSRPEVRARIPRLSFIAALCTLALIAAAFLAWSRYSVVNVVPRSSLLWSAFFRSPQSTQIITSDPNIAEIDGYTGGQLSVSDYANHNYIPDPSKLSPEISNLCRNILRGDKAAAVDVPIALYIGQMALASSREVSVHAARSIQIQDLASEDNFVFLGSPRSNPWSALFGDQLDFRFVFDPKTKTEFIRNEHPRPRKPPRMYQPRQAGKLAGASPPWRW